MVVSAERSPHLHRLSGPGPDQGAGRPNAAACWLDNEIAKDVVVFFFSARSLDEETRAQPSS
jgi:hypothetical protein